MKANKHKSAKLMLSTPEFRPRRERSKKTDYSRKGKNKFKASREY
jgi:stalled ribosome alternative rescue factor ArfA